jgi:hypothetical protein
MGASEFSNDLFQFVDVLRTSVSSKTKRILAQVGSVVGRTVDGVQSEWWQHVGFISRPSKPVAGHEAARAISLRRGNVDAIIASEDDRGLELKGNLADGETCIYAAGEDGNAQARILLKADGSVNIFTKSGNTSAGTGMGVFVSPDGSISLTSHNGGAMLIGTDASIKAFNANGAIQVAANGDVKVSSATKVGISAPAVVLGGSPAAKPVINSTDLQTFAGLIATALLSIPTGGSAASTALTTAATAFIQSLLTTKRTSAD